jgi:exopolysaccharide production protein ExoZ
MRRLDSLQLGRAAAVLSVLFFHIAGLSNEYQHGYFYFPWTEVLRAGVDVFFVISGVVMVVTTYPRLEQEGIGKRFLIHRVSRIYPPYLFLTVILTLFWLAHPDAVNSKSGGVNLLSSYTLWPSVKQLPLVQVGWTLSYEMMFYLVFFCIIICVKKSWFSRALMLWSLAVVAGVVAIALDSSGILLRTFPRASFIFSPYVLEFVTGCFIAFASLRNKFVAGRTCAGIAIALFVLEAVVCQAMNFDGKSSVFFRVLLFGPPSALLIYGLLGFEAERGTLHVPRWAIRCGDMSYSIYLVHLPVIHFASRYIWRFFDHDGVRPFFMVFTIGLAILTSVIFYRLIERPLSLYVRVRLEGIFKIPAKISIVSAPLEPVL